MYMAECRAIRRTAMSDDSIPTAKKKPLTWQKVESDAIGPRAKVTMGKMTNHSALMRSLWTSNMIKLTEC
jgi:hypothetical protein